jgi:putative Mg2+ transporter-C (MgtC) family protein
MDALSAPGDIWVMVGRLALATALGAVVGLNREMSRKPAGLRTHALVSLAAALATIVGMLLTNGPAGDPSAPARIVQGIVAGVGFIGGGVIMFREDIHFTHGLTTAASIWVVSAVGVAAGGGLWRTASVAVALTLLVLTVGRRIDRALHHAKD